MIRILTLTRSPNPNRPRRPVVTVNKTRLPTSVPRSFRVWVKYLMTNSCTAATAATYAYEASRRTRRVRAQAIASACTVLPYVYVCPLLKYSNSHLQYEIKIQQFTTTSSSVQLCCEIANTLALTGNQQDEPQLSAVNGCNRRLRSANTKKLSVQRTTVIGTSR